MIQIHLLAAIICSQTDEIALVGYYIIEFVLTEEAAKRRVCFAFLLACFDRNREVLAIVELPTYDRMRDLGRPPKRENRSTPRI